MQDASPRAGRQQRLRPQQEQVKAALSLLRARTQPGLGARGPQPSLHRSPCTMQYPKPPSSPPIPLVDYSHGDKADPDLLPLPSPPPPIFHLSFARLPPTLVPLLRWARVGSRATPAPGGRVPAAQRGRRDVAGMSAGVRGIPNASNAMHAAQRSRAETYRKCREKLRSFPICQGAVGTKGRCFRSSCS